VKAVALFLVVGLVIALLIAIHVFPMRLERVKVVRMAENGVEYIHHNPPPGISDKDLAYISYYMLALGYKKMNVYVTDKGVYPYQVPWYVKAKVVKVYEVRWGGYGTLDFYWNTSLIEYIVPW
jgi:hypothetical protein